MKKSILSLSILALCLSVKAQTKVILHDKDLNYMSSKADTATMLLRNTSLPSNQVEYILSKINGIFIPIQQQVYERQKFVADSLSKVKKIGDKP